MVERQLPKLNVASSNLVSRSNREAPKSQHSCGFRCFSFILKYPGKARKNPHTNGKVQVKCKSRCKSKPHLLKLNYDSFLRLTDQPRPLRIQNFRGAFLTVEPCAALCAFQHDGHPVVDLDHRIVGRRRENDKATLPAEVLIQPGHVQHAGTGQIEPVFRLRAGMAPLEKAGRRNHASRRRKTAPEHGLLRHGFRPGVDDDSLSPETGETPRRLYNKCWGENE